MGSLVCWRVCYFVSNGASVGFYFVYVDLVGTPIYLVYNVTSLGGGVVRMAV